MERFLKIMWRVLRPGMAWVILLTPISAAALIYTFVTGSETTPIGYVSFIISAYTTAVLAVNIVPMASRIQASIDFNKPGNRVKSAIYNNRYGNLYMTDMNYRTKISLYLSLGMNVLYAAFKLVAGIHYASFWYGADAIFYVVLSAAQFFMLRYMRKKDGNIGNEYRIYRFCGGLLFVLNATLIGVVYQIVHQNMGYEYPGLMIYTVATYAFIYLTTAIINVFQYRKLNSPVLSAVKAIRLAKALVAIFALQTAMLTSFGGEETAAFKQLSNTLTGAGVCFFIFLMAVYMVVRANKKLRGIA